jgi:polyhydroxyalkanoate synthase
MNAAEALAPQLWFDTTPAQSGSWWPVWQHWLAQHSSGARVAPPPLGCAGFTPLAEAPGTYVLQK